MTKKIKETYKSITRPSFTKTLKGFDLPNLQLDINGLTRNSIPTSDRILERLCKENFTQSKNA